MWYEVYAKSDGSNLVIGIFFNSGSIPKVEFDAVTDMTCI
jgi:hypothetical protein